jgi:uncharacterized membrane protein YcfT
MKMKSETIKQRARDGSRVGWVDYAKGICIFAVVTMYCTHHVQQAAQATGWMQQVVEFARPFRMPDFFLISGLFVSRVIDRPWRRYIDTKVLHFMYFYAVWVTFRFAYTDLRMLAAADPLSILSSYVHLYIEPPSGPLWFIYLLALFFITVRVTRPWPALPVLIVGIGLQVADLQTGAVLVDKFAHYFVFFYSGHLLARQVFRLAEWAQSHGNVALAALFGWFAINGALVEQQWADLPGVSLLLGYAGAFAVILAAALLARIEWMRWLRYLGQNSLVIYLGFVIPLGVMRYFVAAFTPIADIGTIAFTVTLASVAGAVLLYWALRNTPLRFLYERPAWASIAAAPAIAAYRREGRESSKASRP